MKREPARIIAAVEALLTLLVAFGVWQVTDVQIEAILVFVGAVLTLIVGGTEVVRAKVYSPATVEREFTSHPEPDADA